MKVGNQDSSSSIPAMARRDTAVLAGQPSAPLLCGAARTVTPDASSHTSGDRQCNERCARCLEASTSSLSSERKSIRVGLRCSMDRSATPYEDGMLGKRQSQFRSKEHEHRRNVSPRTLMSRSSAVAAADVILCRVTGLCLITIRHSCDCCLQRPQLLHQSQAQDREEAPGPKQRNYNSPA